MRSPLLPIVLPAVALLAACSSNKASQKPDSQAQPVKGVPASLEQKAQRLRTALEATGYQVAQGYFALFTIEDCRYTVEKMGNCAGNNPAAPYIVASVPLWPDEFVDERQRNLFGSRPENTWATFRLDDRDALVVLGQLPPPGGYFGVQPYVFSRQGSVDFDQPLNQTLPADMRGLIFAPAPNSSRALTLATFADAINNVNIERQSGASFGQERFFVMTPDAVMARRMTEALGRAGVPDSKDVFVYPVSNSIVRTGLGEAADDLMVFLRYAEPDDKEAGQRWRQQLPLTVLRVRDANTSRATEPFPAAVYEERTGPPEQWLAGDLASLVGAVKQRWSQPDAPEKPMVSMELSLDLVGQRCLARPRNCVGDNQETAVPISDAFNIDTREVLAVVGTLGIATGKATYVGLSVNHSEVLTGVANISGKDLVGSASAFTDTVGNADKLYVQYLARDCAGLSPCQQITEEMVPRGDTVRLLERNYIVPGTARGADPRRILYPTVIVFDGSKRPPVAQ